MPTFSVSTSKIDGKNSRGFDAHTGKESRNRRRLSNPEVLEAKIVRPPP